MTFGDLQNLVAYYVDDLNFGYFTKDQVKRFLNDAQFKAAFKLIQAGENYYLKCKETTTVINQCAYTVPEDFLKVNRLEIVRSGTPPNEDRLRLEFIPLNQQDMVGPLTGTPSVYNIGKNSLRLFPTPDTVLPLRLSYTHKTVPMTLDAEVPDVPEVYHELIALYAAEDCLLKDGREATLLKSKIDAFEKAMEEDAEERNVDQPRSINMTDVDVTNGDFTGWY